MLHTRGISMSLSCFRISEYDHQVNAHEIFKKEAKNKKKKSYNFKKMFGVHQFEKK